MAIMGVSTLYAGPEGRDGRDVSQQRAYDAAMDRIDWNLLDGPSELLLPDFEFIFPKLIGVGHLERHLPKIAERFHRVTQFLIVGEVQFGGPFGSDHKANALVQKLVLVT